MSAEIDVSWEGIGRAEAARELLARQQARGALMPFTTYTNPAYQVAPHNQRIAARLDQVERGEIKRLLITAPPRHGKTELASRRFPAYYLGRHPAHDIISCSYGQDLSLDFSRDVRMVARSREYRNVFPAVGLAPDSQAANRWHVISQDARQRIIYGGYVAAGIGTAITGRGAHLLNIDDPVKSRAEAESEQIRKTTWDWYRSVAYTRLMPGGAVVLTLTRWHEEDLAGMVLMNAAEEAGDKGNMTPVAGRVGDWVIEHLPAINAAGEALWPERYPIQVLEEIRRTIGEYDWNALYMGQPRPAGGSFFTEDCLLVNSLPVEVLANDDTGQPGKLDYVVAVIDTALKTGKDHDGLAVTYFGGCRFGQCQFETYILDWDYLQVDGALLEKWLPTVFARCEELAKQYRARFGFLPAHIEDKGSGTILIQQGTTKGLPVKAIESGLTAMGKAERAFNASPYIQAGKVKFTPWAYNKTVTFKGITKNHLLAQILNFRAGTQETDPDDCLDTFTYGIALIIGNYLGF